jgi:hypothetical protein
VIRFIEFDVPKIIALNPENFSETYQASVCGEVRG